jgi:hypothetical protein
MPWRLDATVLSLAPVFRYFHRMATSVLDVFEHCNAAVSQGAPIQRASQKDKEFHFQNWFSDRLNGTRLNFDAPSRNTYPDFRMVASTEGYETKGLEFPGRIADFDCNSQVPAGVHNGRTIFYVFGRYPKSKQNTYPVIDFVICHGNLLNARDDYIHKNKSFRGFGSYGDILVRDRKMYVAPTPFGLLDGLDRQVTLILPADVPADSRFTKVGEFERVETRKIVTSYTFNLKTNDLTTNDEENPHAGKVYRFAAYRMRGAPATQVQLKARPVLPTDANGAEED